MRTVHVGDALHTVAGHTGLHGVHLAVRRVAGAIATVATRRALGLHAHAIKAHVVGRAVWHPHQTHARHTMHWEAHGLGSADNKPS